MADEAFNRTMRFEEIKIRGIYLSRACDFEFLLTEVICMCFIESPNKRLGFKSIMLEKPMLGKKLLLAKRALKDFSPHYYDLCINSLNNIDNFVKQRNIYAHSIITFDSQKKDESILIFKFIKDGKLVKETKKIDDIYLELNSFGNDFDKLVGLTATLIRDRGMSKDI